jgi:alkanesulfonate monooxygenase SsuD/methylene tetrahydromethanopterin reductase-like flavin-dependent oxidoreductase (luciferase family)
MSCSSTARRPGTLLGRWPDRRPGRRGLAGPAAAFADGWYGFNLTLEAAAERIAALAGYAERAGRRPGELTVSIALADGDPRMLPELARAA